MLEIMNPANGTLLACVPEDTARAVGRKVRAARLAQPAWRDTPLAERVETMRRFRSQLVQRHRQLSVTLTQEVGKPISQSESEVAGVLGRIDFFIAQVEAVLATRRVFDDPSQAMQEEISLEPLGVVANISAWNYPYYTGANVFIPALLAGNAVLYKPSEHATLTGQAITGMMHAAGVPRDVFAMVCGGAAAGAALVRSELDGVFFTGSYNTGCAIARASATRMIKMQLELGGKDPAYVCDDAPVADTAAALADGAFYNAGQSCCSVERIYVHAGIYDKFVDHFVSAVKSFKLGDPMRRDTYLGPLARDQQRAFLEHQIADAVAKGATVMCGGVRGPGPGNYFEPTVLTGVNHSMGVMIDESFGPVIGIARVDGDSEALELMNDSSFGLTAAVYTRDEARARFLLARVRAGSAYWNCCDRVSPRLPWSGHRHSGVGLTQSTYGIEAFARPKAWHLRHPVQDRG